MSLRSYRPRRRFLLPWPRRQPQAFYPPPGPLLSPAGVTCRDCPLRERACGPDCPRTVFVLRSVPS